MDLLKSNKSPKRSKILENEYDFNVDNLLVKEQQLEKEKLREIKCSKVFHQHGTAVACQRSQGPGGPSCPPPPPLSRNI
jgi:hypothetical protein